MAQWVEYYSGDNTKTIITRQIDDGILFPFEDIDVKGSWEWVEKFSRTGVLKLNDYDIRRGVSGAVKLEVAKGWKVKLVVTSENYDYFRDNIEERYWTGSDALVEAYNVLPNSSRLIATLDGDTEDYISIDIDSEVTGIADFRLRVAGTMVNVSSPKKMDDECYLYIQSVYHYEEADAPPTQEELEEEAIADVQEDIILRQREEGTYVEPTTPPTNLEWIFGGIVLAVILTAGGVLALRK